MPFAPRSATKALLVLLGLCKSIYADTGTGKDRYLRAEKRHRQLNEPSHCGCFECTGDIWNTLAKDVTGNSYTCGARISWVMENLNKTEEEACLEVAGLQFPSTCGRGCNPNRCDGRMTEIPQDPEIPPLDNPLTRTTPLYCFPDHASRLSWDGVWGKYLVEAKEDPSGGVCGPSDNRFSSSGVSVSDNELKLQFKRVRGLWTASEARAVLPDDEMPFMYGTYSFSIKSIQVLKEGTGQLVSEILPPSLVLGLFTWDDTERYALRENYNHEIDIEVSRWDIQDNEDAQFLVQPPAEPQLYRFFSGGSQGIYDQSGYRWEFTWNPGSVSWYTDAAGGVSHSYATTDSIYYGTPDRVQCLPADMEIRFNLWNLYGSSTPTGMKEDELVEVVIDDFSFTPSGQTGVGEGGVCTRDCQCDESLVCQNQVCVAEEDSEEDDGGEGDEDESSQGAGDEDDGDGGDEDLSTQASCSANPKCAHLWGDCCPNQFGTMLSCCFVETPDNNPSCSSRPRCSHLLGDCCPAPDGTVLSCCEEETPGAGESPPPSCSSRPRCSHLLGDCCPAPDGTVLSCCEEEAPVAGESNPQSDASCQAHPDCAHLAGSCCPRPDGTVLTCCGSS